MIKIKRFFIIVPFLLCSFSVMAETNLNLDGIISLNNKAEVKAPTPEPKKDKYVNPMLKVDYGRMRREVIKKVRVDIVNEKLNNIVPITPEQIMQYKKTIDIGQKSASIPVNGNIKLINKTVPIILGKYDYDKTIYLSTGFVTTVVFLDVKGNPWPVKLAVKGDGDKISTTRTDKHIIFMSTSAHYSDTNMAFVLEGINVPLNFRVVTNTDKANEKIEVIIQDLGPEAEEENAIEENSLAAVNSEMYGFLDMLPPEKATEIKIKGFHVNAWVFKGSIYIRTSNSDLISPAYAPGGLVESGDGAKVYRLSYSPMIMFSYKGRIYQGSVEMSNELYDKEFSSSLIEGEQ